MEPTITLMVVVVVSGWGEVVVGLLMSFHSGDNQFTLEGKCFNGTTLLSVTKGLDANVTEMKKALRLILPLKQCRASRFDFFLLFILKYCG